MSTVDAMLNLPLGVQEILPAVGLIVKGFKPWAIATGPAATDVDEA
jgi:hypothetical protein